MPPDPRTRRTHLVHPRRIHVGPADDVAATIAWARAGRGGREAGRGAGAGARGPPPSARPPAASLAGRRGARAAPRRLWEDAPVVVVVAALPLPREKHRAPSDGEPGGDAVAGGCRAGGGPRPRRRERRRGTLEHLSGRGRAGEGGEPRGSRPLEERVRRAGGGGSPSRSGSSTARPTGPQPPRGRRSPALRGSGLRLGRQSGRRSGRQSGRRSGRRLGRRSGRHPASGRPAR